MSFGRGSHFGSGLIYCRKQFAFSFSLIQHGDISLLEASLSAEETKLDLSFLKNIAFGLFPLDEHHARSAHPTLFLRHRPGSSHRGDQRTLLSGLKSSICGLFSGELTSIYAQHISQLQVAEASKALMKTLSASARFHLYMFYVLIHFKYLPFKLVAVVFKLHKISMIDPSGIEVQVLAGR